MDVVVTLETIHFSGGSLSFGEGGGGADTPSSDEETSPGEWIPGGGGMRFFNF